MLSGDAEFDVLSSGTTEMMRVLQRLSERGVRTGAYIPQFSAIRWVATTPWAAATPWVPTTSQAAATAWVPPTRTAATTPGDPTGFGESARPQGLGSGERRAARVCESLRAGSGDCRRSQCMGCSRARTWQAIIPRYAISCVPTPYLWPTFPKSLHRATSGCCTKCRRDKPQTSTRRPSYMARRGTMLPASLALALRPM